MSQSDAVLTEEEDREFTQQADMLTHTLKGILSITPTHSLIDLAALQVVTAETMFAIYRDHGIDVTARAIATICQLFDNLKQELDEQEGRINGA